MAMLPFAFDLEAYLRVVFAFQAHIALAISIIALAGGIAIPFQVKVFSEDSAIVLKVLEGTEVRKVFMDAICYQAFIIIILGVFLLVASTVLPAAKWVGGLLLFASAFIGFETLSMISNGRSYADLREKILTKTAMANRVAGGFEPPAPTPPAIRVRSTAVPKEQ